MIPPTFITVPVAKKFIKDCGGDYDRMDDENMEIARKSIENFIANFAKATHTLAKYAGHTEVRYNDIVRMLSVLHPIPLIDFWVVEEVQHKLAKHTKGIIPISDGELS